MKGSFLSGKEKATTQSKEFTGKKNPTSKI